MIINVKKYGPEVIFIGISLLIGFIGSRITQGGMPAYQTVQKPWFTPPAIVFPIVWTVLFILMGYGMARVWKARFGNLPLSLITFFAQLLMNLFWNVWFFTQQWYLFAFIWLAGLLFLVIVMTVSFSRADLLAGKLQYPYCVWLSFAGVLNLAIYLLN